MMIMAKVMSEAVQKAAGHACELGGIQLRKVQNRSLVMLEAPLNLNLRHWRFAVSSLKLSKDSRRPYTVILTAQPRIIEVG